MLLFGTGGATHPVWERRSPESEVPGEEMKALPDLESAAQAPDGVEPD